MKKRKKPEGTRMGEVGIQHGNIIEKAAFKVRPEEAKRQISGTQMFHAGLCSMQENIWHMRATG